MSWEHKTAPALIICEEETFAELKRLDRKGVHAQLPMTSKNNARVIASAAKLGEFEDMRTEYPVFRVVNQVPSRCHPDRPKATADGKCVICAVEWYSKRVALLKAKAEKMKT
jgi:hypothetical protein